MSPVTSPTAALPGWRLILDAFMAAPDRTLTNVELGQVRGVQAFHQRITDLGRKGYAITDAVRIGKGYYAYDLIGVKASAPDDLPYADALPRLPAASAELGSIERRAVERIEEHAEALLKRTGPPRSTTPTGPASQHLEALRQEVATARGHLAHAIERAEEDASLLELAERAVREIETLRAVVASRPARQPREPRADRGPTGPQLMRKALEHHGAPVHAAAIAAWVMTNGGADVYHGKTPAATMAAQLATSNKTGGEFEKVAAGCYALREWPQEQKDREPVREAAAA